MRRALVLACIACSAPEHAKSPRPSVGAPLVAPGLRLPDDAIPLAYDLRLEISPASEMFSGTVAIKTRLTTATDHVWLHADRITINDAHWEGGTLALDPVKGDEMRAFRFGRRVEPGVVTLHVSFTGSLVTDQEGLFQQQAIGGGWYVFSQGESVFARRYTPCFDEPRFKTPWKVTLVVPKTDVALSNMPEVSEHVVPDAAGRFLPDGRKEVSFAESPPLPSYLVAIAVGPFDLVDAGRVGKGNVPVRVAVRHGAGKQVGVVAAKLPAVLAAIEAYTGEALPSPKLDLVAVPHLFGAMENPGLITFDEPMLVGDPKDHDLASYFVLVAAHELSHQWFGNAVTPAWWDDLWLSEGFASWLGNKVEGELGAIDDPQLRSALTRREAIAADEGDRAAPLRRVMLHNEDPDNSFDEIAYQKGHAVLSTFEAFLGADRFRDVLRGYLTAHRGGTATTADLVAEIRKATDDPTAQSFEQYVRNTGVPVVDLALRCDAKPAVIAHAHDHAVPVCIRFAAGKGSAETCALVGDHTELAVGGACPAWVLGNSHGGYYHTAWTTNGPRGPAPKLAQLDETARLTTGDDLAAAITRGELPAKDALAELRALADSHDPYAQLGAIAIARALDRLVDDTARPAWSAWLAARFSDRFAPAHRAVVENELASEVVTLIPADRFPSAVTRAAVDALDKMIADGGRDLPDELVTLAAAAGGDKLFTRIADRARTLPEDSRTNWLESLGHFGSAQVPLAVALLADPSFPPDEAWSAVDVYFDRPATRIAAWRALKPALPAVLKRMPAPKAAEMIDATGAFCDTTSRDEVVAAFTPHLASIQDGKTHLDRALASIERCITVRGKLGDISAALAASK